MYVWAFSGERHEDLLKQADAAPRLGSCTEGGPEGQPAPLAGSPPFAVMAARAVEVLELAAQCQRKGQPTIQRIPLNLMPRPQQRPMSGAIENRGAIADTSMSSLEVWHGAGGCLKGFGTQRFQGASSRP